MLFPVRSPQQQPKCGPHPAPPRTNRISAPSSRTTNPITAGPTDPDRTHITKSPTEQVQRRLGVGDQARELRQEVSDDHQRRRRPGMGHPALASRPGRGRSPGRCSVPTAGRHVTGERVCTVTGTHRPMARIRAVGAAGKTANPLTLQDLQVVSEAFGFGSVAALVTSLLDAQNDQR